MAARQTLAQWLMLCGTQVDRWIWSGGQDGPGHKQPSGLFVPGPRPGLLARTRTAAMRRGTARICNDARWPKARSYVPHSVERCTGAGLRSVRNMSVACCQRPFAEDWRRLSSRQTTWDSRGLADRSGFSRLSSSWTSRRHGRLAQPGWGSSLPSARSCRLPSSQPPPHSR